MASIRPSGLALGVVVLCAAAAEAQLMRFQELTPGGGQYIVFQGSNDAALINASTGSLITSTPHVWSAPAETPTSGGGQTGGGFIDNTVLVGECYMEASAYITDLRAGCNMTFSFNGHSWFDSANYFASQYNAGLNTIGPPAGILVVTGPGPMSYTEEVTGDVPAGMFRLHSGPGQADPFVTGGVIVPGTYFIRLNPSTFLSVGANASSPNNVFVGSYSLTIPSPASGGVFLVGFGVCCRRRRSPRCGA